VAEREILSADEIRRALVRIAHEIVEKHGGTDDLALVGVQRRGVPLAYRISASIADHERVEFRGGPYPERGGHGSELYYRGSRDPCRGGFNR